MAQKLHNIYNSDELKAKMQASNEERTTLSFYKYAYIGNPVFFRDHFYLLLDRVGVLGRIYVAHEGINGQISVPNELFTSFHNAMDEVIFLQNIRYNIAIEDDGKSFFKLNVKVRPKIVADGLDDASFDVTDRGQHVNAEQYNQLTNNPNTIVVDMRNHYESEVGHFENAIRPDVETFRQALPEVEKMLESKKDRPIIMYCTGGIRCEKASAYFKHKGFEHIYQLDGGIIEYARQVENLGIENKFIGKNFVFDDRLGERISEKVIAKCHQCGNDCDNHTNCKNDACHILFIQCDDCAINYSHCCSTKCAQFLELSEVERQKLKAKTTFNGTKFGKGRYKAHHKDEKLILE